MWLKKLNLKGAKWILLFLALRKRLLWALSLVALGRMEWNVALSLLTVFVAFALDVGHKILWNSLQVRLNSGRMKSLVMTQGTQILWIVFKMGLKLC
jgi:hypothetical protein